ncbi:hypothetical protein Tco_0091266 [Tanacetum coccineum]
MLSQGHVVFVVIRHGLTIAAAKDVAVRWVKRSSHQGTLVRGVWCEAFIKVEDVEREAKDNFLKRSETSGRTYGCYKEHIDVLIIRVKPQWLSLGIHSYDPARIGRDLPRDIPLDSVVVLRKIQYCKLEILVNEILLKLNLPDHSWDEGIPGLPAVLKIHNLCSYYDRQMLSIMKAQGNVSRTSDTLIPYVFLEVTKLLKSKEFQKFPFTLN